ncbi:MAG: penicillin-binding protein 1C [Prevotellaceae bacterium]|jgi:penicillin-binding protein 1C|nr:penicillin-binding protein 1C [Prevotellaceae bacterium]
MNHRSRPFFLLPAALFLLLVVGFLCLPTTFKEQPASTLIVSADGHLMGAKIAADGQWRFPVDGQLPFNYIQCLVAFEDKRFYSHSGIDPLAIARAVRTNIARGRIVEGGSTITMQTVRLMRGNRRRTLLEKAIEALLAWRLECRYSKAEILQLYAGHAPFGGNVVGLNAAAWRYFGRPPDALSWAEAAMLAVLPNAPALIHPGRNRTQLLQKRNSLLAQISRQGYLSPDDLPLAQAEPLPEKPLPLPSDAPHLLERLAQTGEGKIYRTSTLYALQQRSNETIARHARRQRGNKVHNMAAIILENETGRVLAYIGNAPAEPDARQGEQVDITMAARSTGSILKPFLYAAMLDEGALLPAMLLPDVPTYINGFAPQNYLKSYDGAVEAHRALERSLNIPAVLLLQEYGVARFQALLQRMGFTTLNASPDHYGLSLILGGAEVTLWETANAYAAMARTVNRFAGRSGRYSAGDWAQPRLLADDPPPPADPLQPAGLLNAAACWQILMSLSEADRPEGEAQWQRFPSSRRIAWKTGTSFGNRDAWAIGTTPQYTVGVWVGNATGEGRPALTGVQAAAPALFDLFALLPATSWFAQPYDEMTRVALCRQSGHRATDLCGTPDSVWIANAGLDSRPCPYHRLVHLDHTERYRVTSDCEDPHRIVAKPWFALPPAQELFYKTKHANYTPLPPRHPHCLRLDAQPPMDLLYPQNGFRIVLARQMDGRIGRLIMQAAHRRPDATIYWHLDKAYIGATRYPHQMPAIPDTGRHVVTLVDNEGTTLSRTFSVAQ